MISLENYDGPSLEAIALRLRLTRQVFDLNQTEFCKKANISINAYNQYEQAVRRPSLENAIALCDAYNLTLDWVYRGDPSSLQYSLADAIRALKLSRQKNKNLNK